MANTAPLTPAGDDRNLIRIDDTYLALSFEDKLQIFWGNHSKKIILVLCVIVLAILSKGAFAYFAAHREKAIIAEYGAASGTVQLQAFTKAHPDLPISGLAYLRLADEAYSAGSYRAAEVDYSAAAKLLGEDPLAARARLGAAVSLLQAGDASAQNAFQVIANDAKQASVLRAEAAYHLAILNRDAGKTDEASRWLELVINTDASGFWGQRAAQLRDTLPAPAAGPAVNAPMITLPTTAK